MPNLNDQARRLWDKTTHLMANDEARASFLQEVDKDKDGKVTAEEIRAQADSNQDGFVSGAELERLAIKAQAGEFDKSTIKAMAQAANTSPHLVLFEVEPEPPVTEETLSASVDALSESEAETPAPEPAPEPAPPPKPALRAWKAAEGLTKTEQSFRTSIPYSPDALPSRQIEALKDIKAGVLRVQEQVGNSCGTTSLSMLLKYHQGHTLENTVTTIDKYIRAKGKLEIALPTGLKSFDIDGYTAPRDIVDYANSHGMRAGLKNNASTSELKAYLDKGVPIMCLTDWNFEAGSYDKPAQAKPDGKSAHWINVIGYDYQNNPQTHKQELYFTIANPHGVIQQVSESDFKQIWSKLGLSVGGKQIDTGMNRLFVAMVPRDSEAKIIAPNGTAYRAGAISIPTGSDGIKGWAAQKGSEVMQKAGEFQQNLANRSSQLATEASSGYDRNGVLGALENLWKGDPKEINNLREIAKRGGVETKVQIINELLEKSSNRSAFQQLVYDILKDVPFGKDFNQLLAGIDTRRLASRLENDTQAGKVLGWIAKSEIDATGKTGPKFEAFSTQLAVNNRDVAIRAFLKEENVVKGKLFHAVPASLVRDAVNNLTTGITTAGEQTAIYDLLQATSWIQFEQVMSGLNMANLASEMDDDAQLGNLLGWVIELGTKTGNWQHTSEILNQLSGVSEFTRADNVLGQALGAPNLQTKLSQIPVHLRSRMIDLMDDRLRWRTPEALKALEKLQALR